MDKAKLEAQVRGIEFTTALTTGLKLLKNKSWGEITRSCLENRALIFQKYVLKYLKKKKGICDLFPNNEGLVGVGHRRGKVGP